MDSPSRDDSTGAVLNDAWAKLARLFIVDALPHPLATEYLGFKLPTRHD